MSRLPRGQAPACWEGGRGRPVSACPTCRPRPCPLSLLPQDHLSLTPSPRWWPKACKEVPAWGHLGDTTRLSEPLGPRPRRGAVRAGLGPLGDQGGVVSQGPAGEPRTPQDPGPCSPSPPDAAAAPRVSVSPPEGRCLPRPLLSPPPPHVTPVLSRAPTGGPAGSPVVPASVAGQDAWAPLGGDVAPRGSQLSGGAARPHPCAAHGLRCSVPKVSPPEASAP